ncbi:MAG: hypothetical protein ACTHOO_11615 [Alcanivorax sp.]
MKHPIFCLFMVFALVVSTASPMTILNAAELWNSQSGKSKSGTPSYYNASKGTAKHGITLYNKQSNRQGISLGNSGLKSTLQGYKKVEMTGQHKSKLWGFMSDSAAANRQADIDNALQIEYETQKYTSKEMTKVINDVRAYQLKGQQKHAQDLNEYYEQKALEEQEREKKKQAALNGHTYKAPAAYTSKGVAQAGQKKAYKTTVSKPTKAGEVSVELKRAPKLFNTPNR